MHTLTCDNLFMGRVNVQCPSYILRACPFNWHALKSGFSKFAYLPRHALRVGTREFSLLRACSKNHVSGFSGMLLKAEKKVSR